MGSGQGAKKKFLSTPSARRATLATMIRCWQTWGFLSTPSARRATPSASAGGSSAWYFYPRPPRGGRPDDPVVSARRDGFLSTPSARRATITHLATGG